RAASTVSHKPAATPTAARSTPAAFSTSTPPATTTAISPASLSPTDPATSPSAAARSSRTLPLKFSTQPAAVALPINLRTTRRTRLIRIPIRHSRSLSSNLTRPVNSAVPESRSTHREAGGWVGATCSSIDSPGHIVEFKYPSAQPAYTPPYNPGPSSVTWQPAKKPFVPGADAIKGGPGKGPQPGAPLFVCRVQFQNNLYPGKGIQGTCQFADGQHELAQDTYEVATGPAEWRDFDGNIGAMVPGGYA